MSRSKQWEESLLESIMRCVSLEKTENSSFDRDKQRKSISIWSFLTHKSNDRSRKICHVDSISSFGSSRVSICAQELDVHSDFDLVCLWNGCRRYSTDGEILSNKKFSFMFVEQNDLWDQCQVLVKTSFVFLCFVNSAIFLDENDSTTKSRQISVSNRSFFMLHGDLLWHELEHLHNSINSYKLN